MLRTRATVLFDVDHPVALGGMGSATSPALVAAVANAGGLAIQGGSGRTPAQIHDLARDIRALTSRPFGINLLLFQASDELIGATLEARPPVLSTAWARPDQDLAALFARAHAQGAKVLHMVSRLDEARLAADAGADCIVAQGTEGGGHVGLMGSSVFVRQVARAVNPTPVLAAGGVADGAGLVAALALGAEGVLLGTRFLATSEAPLPDRFKEVIIASDGHDTLLTEIPDIASGTVWPGAYARVTRNRLVQDWLGREGELRRRRVAVQTGIQQARAAGDPEGAILYAGQVAGLIDAVEPAAAVVRTIVAEAEAIITARLPGLIGA